MALKIGKESIESSFKLYKGIAAVNVLAVNPTRKELSMILGRDIENEPEYVTKTDDGKTQVRIVFYTRTNPESKVNNGISIPLSISFTLIANTRVGQTTGKTQVIDKYGRPGWVTPEELAAGAIPIYKNGPANLSKGYRPACIGEEYLTEFLLKWLNIPNPADYIDGKWVMKKDPSDSEIDLNVGALFKGDFSELKSVVEAASKHLVKVAVGIRTTEEGKQYHNVFTRAFERNAVTNYSKLDATIMESQAKSGSVNVLYSALPLHEHVVDATDYQEAGGTSPDLPTGSTPWDD